jgi:hypothetical protein
MNSANYINECTKISDLVDFRESGLKTMRENKADDYFIYGDVITDRTDELKANMGGYKANNYVRFSSRVPPYDFESQITIKQNGMFVTDEMTIKFFQNLQKENVDIYLTIDTNSIDREFLLLLSTMIFKSKSRIIARFVYFSSGKPETEKKTENEKKPYDLPKWKEIEHHRAEVLHIAPGVPVFDKTALVLVSGYEVQIVKSLIDKFRPHRLLLGHNERGTHTISHDMNLEAIEDIRSLMERYKNSSLDDIKDFECDVRNPLGCCKHIDEIIQKYCPVGTHIKLAATNTKLSIVGAALCAARKNSNHNIQIVYAKPKVFDERNFSFYANQFYEYTYNPSHLEIEF